MLPSFTSFKNYLNVLDLGNSAKYDSDLPVSDNLVEITPILQLPVYGELLVLEQHILNAGKSIDTRIQNLLMSIVSDVRKAHDIPQDIENLFVKVMEAIEGNGYLQLYNSKISAFDPEIPIIKKITNFVAENPDYNPDTLVLADQSMDLRKLMFTSSKDLKALGVIGADPYEQLKNILNQTSFVTEFEIVTYNISPQVDKYFEIYDLLSAYLYQSRDDFRMNLLLYTRLGLYVAPPLLVSSVKRVQKEVESEFPRIEPIVENTNEADQLNPEDGQQSEESSSVIPKKSAEA